MSSRRVLAVLVGVLALSVVQVAVAGSPARKSTKKTFVGVIEKVDVKQQTITVKMPAASQQIQTQGTAQNASATSRIFRIDAATVATCKIVKASKTQAQAEQGTWKFLQLQVGQLVRVVYEGATEAIPATPKKTAKPAQSNPAIQQTPVQQTPPERTQQTPASPNMDLKAGGVQTGKTAGKARHAISVEILSAGKPQAPAPVESQGSTATESQNGSTAPVPSAGPTPTPAPVRPPVPDAPPAPAAPPAESK
jgi:hypothetical protein